MNRPDVKEKNRQRAIERMNRPEVKEKNRQRAKQRWQNMCEEDRADLCNKIGEANKKAYSDPKVRENLSNAIKDAYTNNPELHEKLSNACIEKYAKMTKEERQEAAKHLHTEEIYEKISASNKIAMNRPDVKERHRKAVKEAQTRDVRLKNSISHGSMCPYLLLIDGMLSNEVFYFCKDGAEYLAHNGIIEDSQRSIENISIHINVRRDTINERDHRPPTATIKSKYIKNKSKVYVIFLFNDELLSYYMSPEEYEEYRKII